MRGWKKAAAVWSLFILLWVHPADAFGSEADLGRRETFDSVGALIREEEDMQTEGELFSQMPDLGLEKIQQFLNRQQTAGELSFTDLMKELLEGDWKQALSRLLEAARYGLLTENSRSVRFLAQAAALGVLGAVFSQAAAVFPSSRVAETGFFITYLLVFICLTAGFFTSMDTASNVADSIFDFMRVLLPSFFLAVAFAGGSISAAAMYSSVLAGVGAADFLCGTVLLPMVKVYVLLVLAGNLSREPFITRLTGGVESGIRWALKTVTGIFLGLQMIQTMILPFADSVKRAGIQKAVSVIPGVGAGAEAILQVAVGSGVLVKNTIGGGAVAAMVILAAAPVVKLMIFMLLYRAAAALMEPVCDKRLTACAEGMGKAHQLLLGIVTVQVLFFAVTIGIVCSATNTVYFGG